MCRITAVRASLIHHYWRERIGLTATARGRNRAIAEFKEIQEQFQDVDSGLHVILMPYAALRGIAEDKVLAKLEESEATHTALDGYLPEELPDLSKKSPPLPKE